MGLALGLGDFFESLFHLLSLVKKRRERDCPLLTRISRYRGDGLSCPEFQVRGPSCWHWELDDHGYLVAGAGVEPATSGL